MSYADFKAISVQPNGCVHARAPHGCGVKVLECVHCGTRYTQRCGNDPVLSHQVELHSAQTCGRDA